MDKLMSYQVFTKVAELESFTKAADSLNMLKASVSMHVSNLEDQLGVQLFHRTTRVVKLTQDGELFLQKVLDFLNYQNEMDHFFQSSKKQMTGKIRVDVPIGFSKGVLMPNLYKFLSDYPDIQLELSSTDRYVDVVGEGFDCVVRVGNLNDSSLIARKTGELKIVSCASKAYIKKYGTPVKLGDLEKHLMIEYKSSFNQKDFGFEYYDREKKQYKNLKMPSRITVNNSEAYTLAAVNGFGIIQAPDIGVRPLIEQGILVEVLPQLKVEPMPVHILYPNKKNISQKVRIFMDWLTEQMANYK